MAVLEEAKLRIYEEIKDMSDEEIIQHIRKKAETGLFKDKWKSVVSTNSQK